MEGGGSAADLVGVFHHGTKFADAETPAVIAAPFRPVKHREAILQGDEHGDQKIEGPEDQQGNAADEDIQDPLDMAVIDAGPGRIICALDGRVHNCLISPLPQSP